MNNAKPLLSVQDLKKFFPITRGFFNRVIGQVKAVDGVSFELSQGECFGLVGESGSGKTTVGRCLLRALQPTEGRIIFRPNNQEVDLASAQDRELKQFRHHLQMIFQDPYSSLNPRMTIFDNIGEPLLVNGWDSRLQREDRVKELLVKVGLKPEYLNYYPHAFSGGQRQRICIARALALQPKLIVADEPVSALDVSVQAQVLNLLMDLQQEMGLTYVFVAHDLSVVRHISDRIAVMYLGELVELATVQELFEQPQHPYTDALLAAVPKPDPFHNQHAQALGGEMGDPANPPSGCRFHPRCLYATERCSDVPPQLQQINSNRLARCHFIGGLPLTGSGD